MARVVSDLIDCQITDTGEVFMKYDTLLHRIRCGLPIKDFKALPHEDLELYNLRRPDRAIQVARINGEQGFPDTHCFDFNIPPHYQDLDLDEYLAEKLVVQFPDIPEAYTERLTLELAMIREREFMEDFLRTLIYMCETFDANGVVRGIGRGSACASLVLFLIGTHMVDPIKYDIPITEFLR